MKEKMGLLVDKIKSTWKDKEKRKHLFVVIGIVLVMAAVITVARAKKTTVNDIEIQHTGIIVEEYETDAAMDEETTAPTETAETSAAAEETSEQIFFLEETTAPEEAPAE